MKKLHIICAFICVLTLLVIICVNINRRDIAESDSKKADWSPEEQIAPFIPTYETVSQITTFAALQKYLYTIDETAYVAPGDLDIDKLLTIECVTERNQSEPSVLIFHTHSQEAFADSREGAIEDTIVGVGRYLAEILVKEYGISVVHDTGQYDVKDGKEHRDGSYEAMEPAVKSLLKKYPSVKIVIDLHRDGVPDNVHLITEVNGKPTAKLMLFNGVTKLNSNGKAVEMPELVNPYLQENLALSLKLQLRANDLYPGLMRRIYIRPYRYSLHLMPRSVLVEAGANTNTVEEVKNAMHPLAEVLVRELFGQ